MKVKLTTSDRDEFIGYKNVLYTDLSSIYNNSCFELYVDGEVLKRVPNKQFSNFMQILCSKIRHSGQIVVTGPDICNICMFYNRRTINEDVLCQLLSNSVGFYNCKLVSDEIHKNQLRIVSVNISQNHHFAIGAVRD